MTDQNNRDSYTAALETAERLLGTRLERLLEPGAGEPANSADFKRLATIHTFGDAWPRTDILDVRTRALISVTIAATLGPSKAIRSQRRSSRRQPNVREILTPPIDAVPAPGIS